RDGERGDRGDDDDDQQLAAHRTEWRGDHVHQGSAPTTVCATDSSRELRWMLRRRAASSETSKRTCPSTMTKLMMLPCCNASSESVTISTFDGIERRTVPSCDASRFPMK